MFRTPINTIAIYQHQSCTGKAKKVLCKSESVQIMARSSCVSFTLSLVLFLLTWDHVLSDVYYIIPAQDDPCYTDPCLTLLEFTVNASSYIKSPNTTLFVSGGRHNLDTHLSVSDVAEFSMLSVEDNNYNSNSEIICSESPGFAFSNIDRVYISGLTFSGCGGNRFELLGQLVIENAEFLGQNSSETALIIAESNVNLMDTTFLSNTAGSLSTVSFKRYLESTLKYSTAQSGTSVGGALILTHCMLTIDKCLFEENSANIGGAIFSQFESNITISNSMFMSNHATGYNNEPCFGGVLFIDGSGSVMITNSTFENNTSDVDGGTAVVFNATLVLVQSNFSNNTANRYGGVLAYYECDGILISATTFDNNRANSDGGSVYLFQSSITVQDSDFSYNEANVAGGTIAFTNSSSIVINSSWFAYNSAVIRGGVLSFMQGSTALVQSSGFIHNTAQIYGGVAYAEYSSDLKFKNCTIGNNTAQIGLGGVLFAQIESSVSISGSSILNNTAINGGVVYVARNSSIIFNSNSNFANNQAHTNGGVVFLDENSKILITSSMFSYNEAGNNGGIVSTQNTGSVVISDGSFTFNVAKGSGGITHSQDYVEVLVNRSTFEGNLAGREGGVFDGYSYQVLESIFTDNIANISGGVIRLQLGGILNVENSYFTNNSAINVGGVVYADEQTMIDICQSSFLQNSALSGGVVSVTSSSSDSSSIENGSAFQGCFDSNITLYDSTFSENSASDSGGVIYGSSKIYTSVHNGTFTQNIAHMGGVYSIKSNSIAYINDSIFRNNAATSNGGVINVQINSSATMGNSVFISNGAESNGAVIYTNDRTSIVIMNDCEFHQNWADFGGVLVAMRQSTVTIEDSTFSRNKADTDGGILYARTQCRITVNNSTFSNNSVVNDGIILASRSSNVTLKDSNFSHNDAGDDGGVGYVYDSSKITVSNCNLSSNKASDTGGSLYARMFSTIVINDSGVYNSTVENSGGVIYAQQSSNVIIESSTFNENTADYGGVMRIYVRSTASIFNSSFSGNRGNIEGGVIGAYKSSIVTVQASLFTLSFACFGGVSIVYDNSNLTFKNNQFINNSAELGAVIRVLQRNFINIIRNTFQHNIADFGGVVYAQGSNITVESSWFEYNNARLDGGAINGDRLTISFTNTTFSNNTAADDGGSIFLIDRSVATIINSSFLSNSATDTGGVMNLLQQSEVRVFNSVFLQSTAGDSGGAMYTTDSSIEITNSTLVGNSAINNGGAVVSRINSSLVVMTSTFSGNGADKSGGVLHIEGTSSGSVIESIFKSNRGGESGGVISLTTISNVTITASNFIQNTADLGGALAAEENSLISFNLLLHNGKVIGGETKINNNTALSNGGGIYLSESSLFLGTGTNILNNVANSLGGGIHAIGSSITITGAVELSSNQATRGGGVSLADSKLCNEDNFSEIIFVLNQAKYGGALYVDDESENNVCSSDPLTKVYPNKNGCFFQNVTNDLSINFINNFANSSGHNLFGGLLDRCTVVSSTAPSELESNGVARLQAISNIDASNLNTISSEPVRVCLCKNDIPDCSQQNYSIQIKRGNSFSVPVAAVDQVNRTVTAMVQSNFRKLTLSDSETVRKIGSNCSSLEYRVSFPSVQEAYDLTLYAEGPCNGEGISRFNVSVYVLSCLCGRGFMQADISTECVCNCDRRYETFSRYIQDCDPKTESIMRRGQFWVAYLEEFENSSVDPYLFYPYCPLDYCQPPTSAVSINLNLPNGSDAQCANNRGGILCGNCLHNYSLSLGSSNCIECPNNWYILLIGITIAAILAGIILIIILLVLNITVAVGTINSIIFYANIINANQNTYFSQSNLTFVPIFISWLNLDIGFDTCFYQGMDTYAKTWIQLAFPTYIIFLVILIIVLSSYSSKFSNLLGKRNPVATLATLMLLSYTKYLQIIIVSFSYATLRYPNGTIVKWFPDANIEYREWKHIVLICVAILIILYGLTYTIVLFSWQWFLRCSRSRLFKCTRNQRLHSFIDTYHIPHTAKHRYWTGLLLFVRVIIYNVAAFSVSEDPRITLLTTVIITCFLFLYKTLLIIRVYKNWLLNAMESFVYFNIVSFAVFTWYTFDDPGSRYKGILQTVAAYVSVGIIVILFLFVLAFHAYRYCNTKIYSLGANTKISKKLKSQLVLINEGNDMHQTSSERDAYKLLDAIDSPRDDTILSLTEMNEEPTTSTVSLNDCEESVTTDSNPLLNNQRSFDSERSFEQEQDALSNVESSGRPRIRAGTQPSQPGGSYELIRLEPAKKAKTKSFTFTTANKNIIKPLLEEDNL